MSATHSIDTAIEKLFDVTALIECAESQLGNDPGNPAVRVLRMACDKLKASVEYLEDMDTKAN